MSDTWKNNLRGLFKSDKVKSKTTKPSGGSSSGAKSDPTNTKAIPGAVTRDISALFLTTREDAQTS